MKRVSFANLFLFGFILSMSLAFCLAGCDWFDPGDPCKSCGTTIEPTTVPGTPEPTTVPTETPDPGTPEPTLGPGETPVPTAVPTEAPTPTPSATPAPTITPSNIINSNVTWSGTIYLTGDITITTSGNLTILPGTRIVAKANSDAMVAGVHTSRIEITVDGGGTLYAQGTELEPIIFTTAAAPPVKGDWYGIRLLNGIVTLNYFVEEYGTEGLYVGIDNLTVEHATIENNNGNGINVEGGRTMTLSSSNIGYNNANGIYCPGTININNCTVNNNSADGIRGGKVNASYCTVEINGVNGIFSDSAVYTTSTFAYCNINNNAQFGIRNDDMNVVIDVTNSNILNNLTAGIAGYSGNCNDSTIVNNGCGIGLRIIAINGINNNIIEGNGIGIGLDAISTGLDNFSGNLLTGNLVGIQISCNTSTINIDPGNDIYSNTEYELRNYGTGAIIANGNYWGDPTTTELNNNHDLSKIWDSHDDPSFGQVVISNWWDTRLTTLTP